MNFSIISTDFFFFVSFSSIIFTSLLMCAFMLHLNLSISNLYCVIFYEKISIYNVFYIIITENNDIYLILTAITNVGSSVWNQCFSTHLHGI